MFAARMNSRLLIACLVLAIGAELVNAKRSPHKHHTRSIFSPSLAHIIPSSRLMNALTLLNNQLFVTRLQSYNQIEVYDTTTFELIRSITVPGASSQLLGLAPCPTGDCIYVSDNGYDKVHKVSLTTTPDDSTVTTTSWSVASGPYGLSVNGRGNLLVACLGKIEEYTPSGSLVRETRLSSNDRVWHAVEHTDGTLAVSRWGAVNDVCLVSVDGQVLRSYGSTGKGPGRGLVNEPRSLAVDKEGFIFAADSGYSRILVLNPTLSEARHIPMPIYPPGVVSEPQGLSLDESRGRLYVGEWTGLNRIMVYDNVVNVGAAFTP